MKTRSVIVLLVMVILSACKKDTTVSGYVYSEHSKPVSGVNVAIGEDNTFKDHVNTYDKATTDSKGFYQFTFSAKGSREYFVHCLCDSGEQSSAQLEKGKANTADLHLVK